MQIAAQILHEDQRASMFYRDTQDCGEGNRSPLLLLYTPSLVTVLDHASLRK